MRPLSGARRQAFVSTPLDGWRPAGAREGASTGKGGPLPPARPVPIFPVRMPRSLPLRILLSLAPLALLGVGALLPEREAIRQRVVVFEGMCDASGAVELSERLLVVADDEDNVLRTYDVERGGPPLSSVDVSPALGLPLRGKKRPRAPELDLEAATRQGDRAYWLTSHGRNSEGRLRPERYRFFATKVAREGVRPMGRPYERLLDDLLAEPRLAPFRLEEAAARAPKEPGGLNIEGLTATPTGELLLAFRNPIPEGRALLVPLRNAGEMVEGKEEVRARFGTPVLLDLGGNGVRSLSWWRGRYLIVGGPYASGGTSRLYEWDGKGQPKLLPIDLGGFNPEGFFTPESRDEILLLSDDGERAVDGVPCKKLKDPSKKRFRGIWLRLPRGTRSKRWRSTRSSTPGF